MKARLFLTGILMLTVVLTASTYANVSPSSKTNTYETIEQNRLIGLSEDNEGLRVSAAFNLGEMKSQKAVLPLMKLLKDGKTEEEKIIAALSLIKIGDSQGVFLVSRAAQFQESARVRRVCEKFYNGYLLQKASELKTSEMQVASN
ncbi:MAG: HEAT repeat domain-containing protein [Melioribacteraceae bacterium]